jgi:uncharacterized Zn-binding protein involved in type VI secretion
LVAEACLVGGLELLSRIQSHRIHPGMLALSPHLTYLGVSVTNDRYPVFLPSCVCAKKASGRAYNAPRSGNVRRDGKSAAISGGVCAEACNRCAGHDSSALSNFAPRNPQGEPI